ncbi:two-component system, chemotaxis family, sensor kinase CheA [Steroidobacter denitrificans]|uniref:Chemotaxis protein CheA n=1 Tax=Steroidobacter denitrificans TaxID=465721 RepID=A0A127FAK5_STEDE|nr:chemotaxis protein CheA [Steroidobacter denitrificans]AMN46625.1 two-component system, chemotaxis family, sensor kinase CheA [Steroidobacter denitrificans]
MAIDLAQFHDAFFDESFEALDQMESALLKLNPGAPDPELINTIFRVAHSIKGGSATFGFSEVASFTHTCETLLDELRGNRMQVTRPITDLLLKSVDVMREMLRAVQHKEPIDAQRVADLQFDLELTIAQKDNAPAASPTPTPTPAAAASQPESLSAPVAQALPESLMARRWRIQFKPYPQLFAHGNDPLRMLRELAEIGDLTVTARSEDLPPLTELEPESCYLSWDLTLDTEVTREVIAQVFDWAEGDCELHIEQDSASSDGLSAGDSGIDAVRPLASPAASAEPTSAPAGNSPSAGAPTGAAASGNVVSLVGEARPAVEPARGTSTPAEGTEGAKSGLGDASSIRVSTDKIDELMNIVGELVITQSMLTQLGATIPGHVAEQLRSGLAQLERNVRELQESVMRVRMLPISFVFSRFPRMVRDVSQRLGKQVALKMTGDQTELDKTILEKIGDPLVHLVRNSVDHGIEQPEVRLAAGKPAHGTVYLEAYHKGGNITVEVSDDGGGLDKEKILAKARARGIVGANEVLSDEAIHDLIFGAGFSTAEQTTDISGRGVGMDVVRRNIKELGGTIEVRSTPGAGSRFIITLPLTLAIVDGQSVAVGTETYIVPLITIIESLQLKPGMVNRVAGQGEVFWFRDAYVPVMRLHEVFGVQPRTTQLHEGLIMVVEGEGRKVGLFVDDLLGQQQVVIKSLESNFRRVDGVSGATILGDGAVALILDVSGLVRVAMQRVAA